MVLNTTSTMKTHHIDNLCELYLNDHYTILRIAENVLIDKKNAVKIRNVYRDHFGSKKFVVVVDRKYKYDLDLSVYKDGLSKNLVGIAVVSKDVEEKKRALEEQELFDHSFAFFENLSEAENWAETFFQ